MHEEVLEESKWGGPARSTAAIVASAAASTTLFWAVGRRIPWGVDLQVAFLLGTFGLILTITVGYSWAIDRVWRRTNREAKYAVMAFKGDFVANLSHELRTALTGIVGFAQLVDARLLGGDNAEAINTVVGQSVELSRVVDDLVAQARLDSGNLSFQPEPVSVLEQVRTAAGIVAVAGAEITIECDDAEILVDPEAFRHILRNLLANAHRHGLPPVSVRGRSFGNQYICQVVDCGPGVPEESAATLLGAFGPVSDGRAGLGLAVAAALAEQMGCELTYRRIRGETHFVLTVPVASTRPAGKVAEFAPGITIPRLLRNHRRKKEGSLDAAQEQTTGAVLASRVRHYEQLRPAADRMCDVRPHGDAQPA